MAAPLVDVLTAVVSGAPALAVAVIGWVVNRRDLHEEIVHLRAHNERLTEALRLALYGRPKGEG